MKNFVRQNATKAPAADIAIDFGAASEQVARVFEPEVYTLQVKTASVRHSHNGNVLRRPRSRRIGERGPRQLAAALGGWSECRRRLARCRKPRRARANAPPGWPRRPPAMLAS